MQSPLLLCSAVLFIGSVTSAQGANDCASATAIAGDGIYAFTGSSATSDSGINCDGSEGPDLWFEWTAQANGDYNFGTCDFAIGGETDTVLSVYTDCSGVPSCVASADDTCDNEAGTPFMADATVPSVQAGDTLLIQIAQWDSDGIGDPAAVLGDGNLTVTNLGISSPLNDTCSSPADLGAACSVSVSYSTALAGDESGAATCGTGANRDVWFSWTASRDGLTNFNTCGSSYDTVIALFESCGGSELACDDGFESSPAPCDGSETSSSFDFALTAGTTYLIQIGGDAGATGDGVLNIQAPLPPNDECANATPVSGTGVLFPFDNICASNSPEPGGTCTGTVGPNQGDIPADIWFVWTADSSGPFELTTCNLSPVADTKIAVYDGSDCTTSLIVDCNDDTTGCANFSSTVNFDAVAGNDYLLRFGAWAGGSGPPYDTGVGEFTVNKVSGNYCSTGSNGALMSASGSTSIAANDFTLEAAPVPNTFGLFYFGEGQNNLPFGDGFRCVGQPNVFRIQPPAPPAAPGMQSRALDFTSFPGNQVQPGVNQNFQYWFRDNTLPSGFDLSDGLRVHFDI